MQGNAIYNLRHPWLRWLHERLEREAESDIPFDVRMANITLEAQRGERSLAWLSRS